MTFVPANRHILVEPIEEKEEAPSDIMIVLPEDYKKPTSPYLGCRVLSVAEDSKFFDKLKKDDTVAIERRMLHKVELQGGEFYLIQDNFVFGRIDK
tara:strand:- start:276 stop:563 length:288 start_codon:yes stop_codon:yes gene_type:complete